MDARALAAKVLVQVLGDKQSLDAALAQNLPKLKDAAARGLVQEMGYGVLRWHLRLDALAHSLLKSPLKDPDIHCLLLAGLYQIMYMRVAPHAAVDMTVAATQALGKPWAKGLVNAVLRTYLRNSVSLLQELDRTELGAYAHPTWLLDMLKADWPAHWQAIAAANNERPPLDLRVNAQKSTRTDYLARLAAVDIAASALPHSVSGVHIDKPQSVETLPGFADGLFSVQDSAAQLAAPLLEVQSGHYVLDACAAPGGKACHILEYQPGIELLALDNKARRVKLVQQNLDRLQLSARLMVGDATCPQNWWDGIQFDRILLDAPCSATGVIRRHPDIKVLRRPTDIDTLAQLQAEMLAALWPLLKSGGMLLYVTCSVLHRENEQQMRDFVAGHADAQPVSIDFPWRQAAQTDTFGQQILPGEEAMDGFYYARLRKL
ncbi:MAG: 16S rRNA (cytosine(967)-C(5))-methyltransferase RsmB [Gammaproteobacteria bacterium]